MSILLKDGHGRRCLVYFIYAWCNGRLKKSAGNGATARLDNIESSAFCLRCPAGQCPTRHDAARHRVSPDFCPLTNSSQHGAAKSGVHNDRYKSTIAPFLLRRAGSCVACCAKLQWQSRGADGLGDQYRQLDSGSLMDGRR